MWTQAQIFISIRQSPHQQQYTVRQTILQHIIYILLRRKWPFALLVLLVNV